MIEIENEKLVPAYLAKHAREFCKTVGAIDIRNICTLGDGDYRIMYNSKVSYHADNAGGAHGKDTNDK